MKYATAVTARRREATYPPHISWLGYDSDNNFIGYFDSDNNEVEWDGTLEDETVTPEKIVQSLSDLIEERNTLKEQLANQPTVSDYSTLVKLYRVQFSIRDDDIEEIYGVESHEAAHDIVKRNKDTFGEKSINNVKITPYRIVFE